MINLNKRFYKLLTLMGVLGLTACSEDTQDYPNLSEIGDRPQQPSVANAKKNIAQLRQDKSILLNEQTDE